MAAISIKEVTINFNYCCKMKRIIWAKKKYFHLKKKRVRTGSYNYFQGFTLKETHCSVKVIIVYLQNST